MRAIRVACGLAVVGLAPCARAEDAETAPSPAIRGGLRFFGGETARRRLAVAPGDRPVVARWSVAAFGAVIARGAATLADSASPLELPLPDVRRQVPAVLRVDIGDRVARASAIELFPREIDAVAAAIAGLRAGVVGPRGAGLDRLEGRFAARLLTPGEVRRFPGRVFVLEPGPWDVRPLLPALLERARSGAAILALGPDAAPWHAPSATAHAWPDVAIVAGTTSPSAEARLLADLGASPLSAWGADGDAPVRPLGDPSGNHDDLVAGVVRDAYVGDGRFLLVGLPIVEHLRDEPVAERLLARLLGRLREPPPPLVRPRSVPAGDAAVDADVRALFGDDRGDGPLVLAAEDRDAVVAAKARGSVVVITRGRSAFHDASAADDGPGLADPAGLLRFLTRHGVRVAADVPWSPS